MIFKCAPIFLYKGWSVLLGKKELKAASKQLREMCCWQSDVPSILSACLISLEPDSNLRLFTDQYTPDERFGQTASNCQLSTPKDASCTHILVFPTSAKAQVMIYLQILNIAALKVYNKKKEYNRLTKQLIFLFSRRKILLRIILKVWDKMG